MKTRFSIILPLAVALAMLGALAFGGAILAAETTLTAELAGGDAEVPPGDPDGSGTASIVIDPDAGTVCYEITTHNIQAATASHIHAGAAGVAGGVVVGLDTDGFDGTTEGCVEGQEAAALQAILDAPGDHYVNVHNAEFPGGAVRGQLTAAGLADTALPADGDSPAVLGLVLLGVAILVGTWRLAATRR